MDRNLEQAVLDQIRTIAGQVPGVTVTAISGRAHGSDVLVELSLHVKPTLSVEQAAHLAEQVRQAVYRQMPNIGDVVVELNTNHLVRLRRKLR